MTKKKHKTELESIKENQARAKANELKMTTVNKSEIDYKESFGKLIEAMENMLMKNRHFRILEQWEALLNVLNIINSEIHSELEIVMTGRAHVINDKIEIEPLMLYGEDKIKTLTNRIKREYQMKRKHRYIGMHWLKYRAEA